MSTTTQTKTSRFGFLKFWNWGKTAKIETPAPVVAETVAAPVIKIEFKHNNHLAKRYNPETNEGTVCFLLVNGRKFVGNSRLKHNTNFSKASGRKQSMLSALRVANLNRAERTQVWECAKKSFNFIGNK